MPYGLFGFLDIFYLPLFPFQSHNQAEVEPIGHIGEDIYCIVGKGSLWSYTGYDTYFCVQIEDTYGVVQ